MANRERGGGGFLWGVAFGGFAGFFLGSYLATERGRQTVAELRQRAEDLANDPELRQRAQSAMGAARDALGDAVKEGVTAARERRQQLAQTVAPTTAQGGESPQPKVLEEGQDG